MQHDLNPSGHWYDGVTRYQWIVLIVASLGWIFDVFEGQIFVASMNEAIPSLVAEGTSPGQIALYNNIAFGSFLLGGALGGILFGILSDRIGRTKTMSLTILFYSLFTCVSSFSQQWWQLAGLRFLVAMGVGGEWAVASSMVAEVFPRKARAHVGALFHGSSVFGTYLAVAAGMFIIGNDSVREWAVGLGHPSLSWRIGFALGVLPALLIVWIRLRLKEPESWQAARKRAGSGTGPQLGRISELFGKELLGHMLIGVTLASVGLATFWGAHIYGKNVLKTAVAQRYLIDAGVDPSKLSPQHQAEMLAPYKTSLKRWEMLGMFLVTTGGGLGLISFGPLCEWIGRRGAFLLFHLGGLAAALLLFQKIHGVNPVMVFLPIFGFLTLGMHAGYAVYFPELFPTRLRGTGAGFCFNGGRILAVPVLLISGWMQHDWGFTVTGAASILSLLFLVGVVTLLFAPETRGQELME